MKRNIMLVWISTLGLTNRKLAAYQQRFAVYFFTSAKGKAYAEALVKLQAHQQNGDDIYIISGAAEWLLTPLCAHLGITDTQLVGTTTKRFIGGLIMDFHCYKENKVIRLMELGIPQQYEEITGYSDSAADIPMLKLCHKVNVINPLTSCLQKFKAEFGSELVCLNWE